MKEKLTSFRTIPRAWTLILHASPSETKKKESTRVGPTDNFEQSKEKNYPPTSLVTLLCIFCVLGRAHSCALCAPSGRRGESRRAGDGNPALLLLCSNWPQQPAAGCAVRFTGDKTAGLVKINVEFPKSMASNNVTEISSAFAATVAKQLNRGVQTRAGQPNSN